MYYRTLGLNGLRVSADKHDMTELLAGAVEMGYSFFDAALNTMSMSEMFGGSPIKK